MSLCIDGYTHAFESVVKRDEIKDERLNELGISVLRFSDEDVMSNIDGVLLRIEDFIGEYERKHTPDPSC